MKPLYEPYYFPGSKSLGFFLYSWNERFPISTFFFAAIVNLTQSKKGSIHYTNISG